MLWNDGGNGCMKIKPHNNINPIFHFSGVILYGISVLHKLVAIFFERVWGSFLNWKMFVSSEIKLIT